MFDYIIRIKIVQQITVINGKRNYLVIYLSFVGFGWFSVLSLLGHVKVVTSQKGLNETFSSVLI